MTAPATANPDPTTEKPPRPKRWIPITLRMFVAIVVTLVLISGLWWAVPAYRQHAAIQGIGRSKLGMHVRHVGPNWLRSRIGNDWMLILFDRVEGLTLQGDKITDADLAHLSGFTYLESLSLGLQDSQVSDVGLAHLHGLSNLKTLNLAGPQITDDSLKHLEGLTNLTSLSLNKQVTDAGLKHLKGLLNLKVLYVDPTAVTKAGRVEWGKSRRGIAWPTYVVGIDDRGVTAANGTPSAAGMSTLPTRGE